MRIEWLGVTRSRAEPSGHALKSGGENERVHRWRVEATLDVIAGIAASGTIQAVPMRRAVSHGRGRLQSE